METLSPAQPLPQTHQTDAVLSSPESQPPPDNSSGQKPPVVYKCLLNQHAQKLKKPLPVYQTRNEGSDHLPRFRSTVWVDGVSYTSSSTFHQRKMSEMDASRVAYIAVTQQTKTDALQFIKQDKIFCKAIMAEFAAKKNIGKPVYETTKLEAPVPEFRSYLHFNGATYSGDSGKSKKEAEQLVARSVIVQHLESESGTDMADLVYCKLRQYFETHKVQENNSLQSDSNVSGAQAGVGNNFALTESGTNAVAKSSAVPESSLAQGTMDPATVPTSGAQLLVEPITPAAPIVIQPPAEQVSTELINQTVSLVTEPSTPHVSTEPIHTDVPVVTQQPSPQVSVEPIKPVAAESLVLTPTPSTVVNNSCAPVESTTMVEMPATTDISPQPKAEASPAQALEYIPLVDQASDKKRSRTSKKNARKKMRANAQKPVIPATGQVLPFSSSVNSSSSV
ncbi:hypothetical protein M8C21_009949 [Ambrosia artemisiifolia]|uniref:DRBM domain-containing protein n=1 Tax=Ambrosia artemisiifolia TaxID=4212 RepID=A0AAD5CVG7_AMBAR|nr:hypothetical protein M8C21_009949 [Ambrosia artemisiifolia]